jgi:PAS domain S-box-containing protein
LLWSNARFPSSSPIPTGAIEYVNPVFTEITGYSSDEVIGRNPRLLKSELMSETFYQNLWANLVAGRTWRGEMINRRKNGSLYWESASISPLRDAAGRTTHYVGVKEDITERKKAEIELQAVLAEAQRLRSALDQVPSLIYIKDTQLRYIYANRLTLELFGCTQETLVGRTDDDFFPPDVAQRLRAIDARVLTGEQTTEEIVVDYPHKKTIYLELKAPIFTDANRSEPFGLVGVSMDITANKEAEAALRASEQRYRGLIESMPALMWVYEGESSPGLYNTRWIEYTGSHAWQTARRDSAGVHSPRRFPQSLAAMGAISDDGPTLRM